MLEATKASVWRNRYNISQDGQPLVLWDGSSWRAGGKFELGGQRYEVRGNAWGTKSELLDQYGMTVAAAERVGRKNWTVQAGARTYTFHRVSAWRSEEELHSDGQRLGLIKRTRVWRSDAIADLPGLPLPVQVFVFAVVLTMWDRNAAAAASAG